MKAKKIFEQAKKEHFAIGAFNVGNLETLKAVVEAGKNLKSPIMIEASHGEITHIGYKQLVSLVRLYEEEYQIPIILNLDHGKDFESVKKAIEAGFDYVHLDGGKMDFDECVKETQKVVKLAHSKAILVEGEIDHIEGSSADHTLEKPEEILNPNMYTKPTRAADFVKKTGIDVFASFIGNLHGIYKTNKHLNLDIFKDITNLLPHTFFSLHGGSGIFEEDVKKAIQMGVVKVNVNSEMRIAFKMTLQQELNTSNEIASYKYMQKPVEEVRKVVERKIRLFGSEGKA